MTPPQWAACFIPRDHSHGCARSNSE
jgi:hypothetical protein